MNRILAIIAVMAILVTGCAVSGNSSSISLQSCTSFDQITGTFDFYDTALPVGERYATLDGNKVLVLSSKLLYEPEFDPKAIYAYFDDANEKLRLCYEQVAKDYYKEERGLDIKIVTHGRQNLFQGAMSVTPDYMNTPYLAHASEDGTLRVTLFYNYSTSYEYNVDPGFAVNEWLAQISADEETVKKEYGAAMVDHLYRRYGERFTVIEEQHYLEDMRDGYFIAANADGERVRLDYRAALVDDNTISIHSKDDYADGLIYAEAKTRLTGRVEALVAAQYPGLEVVAEVSYNSRDLLIQSLYGANTTIEDIQRANSSPIRYTMRVYVKSELTDDTIGPLSETVRAIQTDWADYDEVSLTFALIPEEQWAELDATGLRTDLNRVPCAYRTFGARSAKGDVTAPVSWINHSQGLTLIYHDADTPVETQWKES